MADRYLEHAISCLNRAKENQTDGVYCELSIVEVDMIIDLLKEQKSIIESLESDLHETLEVVSGRLNVVRCKDCINYVPRESVFSEDIQFFKCRILDTDTDPNWFCACGERME